jgi:two-component system, response regulator YesN
MDSRIQKVQQMMRDNLNRELSLAELAQSVNLSTWRLCHLFRTDIGMPPIKYLRSLRLEAAKQLLETSFLSIKEITYKVGLNDESHFVRDFKKVYGMPPSVYRMVFIEQENESENRSSPEVRSSIRHGLHFVSAMNVITCVMTSVNLL